MLFELLIFVIGIVFGYLRKGKEDLMGLLKQGAIIGIIFAVIFGLIYMFLDSGGISLTTFVGGSLGILIGIIILVIIFIIGVFIGDFIEGKMKK
jgi:amino acid transporter